TTAGGTPANYIAKWNGTSWSALGSGMNSSVYALSLSGTNVYAGGLFTTAGCHVSAYFGHHNPTPAVTITSAIPATLSSSNIDQVITVNGTGFQQGLTAT